MSRLTSVDFKNDPSLTLARQNDLDRADKVAQTTKDDLDLVRSNAKTLMADKEKREAVLKDLKDKRDNLEKDIAEKKDMLRQVP